MAKTNNTTPINVAGVKFHDIKEISVNEFCILPDAKGKAEQVHLWIEIEGLSHPLIMRFKSRPSLDKLVVDLIAAANNVWGSKGPSGYGCHNCGAMAEAKPDGSLPDGWKQINYEEGTSYLCEDCESEPFCRICGCTQNNACPDGCYWIEENLCSGCVKGTVKSRHQWAERALKAESKTERIIQELKAATCHGQDKLSLADIETIEKELSK
jgi:hypothetical protein